MISRISIQPRGSAAGTDRHGHEFAESAWGIVQDVDLVARDLTVVLSARVEVFDIPPGCPIVLHGEQIKLRMVQPRDSVRIHFRRDRHRAIVQRLEVQPEQSFGELQL